MPVMVAIPRGQRRSHRHSRGCRAIRPWRCVNGSPTIAQARTGDPGGTSRGATCGRRYYCGALAGAMAWPNSALERGARWWIRPVLSLKTICVPCGTRSRVLRLAEGRGGGDRPLAVESRLFLTHVKGARLLNRQPALRLPRCCQFNSPLRIPRSEPAPPGGGRSWSRADDIGGGVDRRPHQWWSSRTDLMELANYCIERMTGGRALSAARPPTVVRWRAGSAVTPSGDGPS
jgi:hypothetical protein